MRLRIGIDLGGTKTEIIALDTTGATLLRRRELTPVHNYDATLELVRRLVHDAERELGARGSVGVGTPGAASPATGLLRNSNSVCLNGKPLQQDLERVLGREVRLANDANCFALSEARDGAGQGENVVFGVILGTGVGGGIVVGGRVLTGANRIAGEWGHNPLPWPQRDEQPGPPCYCGKTGCIETFASGPGLARDHERHTGAQLEAASVIELAKRGEEAASATLARYEQRLARALASVINVLDPDVVVLGGGLSNVDHLYAAVPELWRDWVFSDVTHTRLARNHHGDSSGVRGAAWLWGD
ncbi:MAG: ROK family protein [Betaproteobacteria bacterium]|nr:ROK family protein [Betaproteobacteria bacterium]